MRKLILSFASAFAVSILFSCNSDDSSPDPVDEEQTSENETTDEDDNSTNDGEDSSTNPLLERIELLYVDPSGTSSTSIITKYENGRRVLDSILNRVPNNRTWNYNSKNQLDSLISKDYSGNIISSTYFTYNENNLIGFESTREDETISASFVYEGNTITATRSSSSQGNNTVVFMQNDNGFIFKKGSGTNVNVELTFEANNVVESIFNNSILTTYTLDETREMPETYANRLRNSFNGNLNNYILWRNNLEDLADVYNTKYLIKETSEDIISYVFTFDGDLPINRKVYFAEDENATPELIYEYIMSYKSQ